MIRNLRSVKFILLLGLMLLVLGASSNQASCQAAANMPEWKVITEIADLETCTTQQFTSTGEIFGGMSQDDSLSYRELARQFAQMGKQNSQVARLSPNRQADLSSELLSNGQFVWGPNVGDFDIFTFLQNRGSALHVFAEDLEMWARYTSLNPKILLAVLELRYGLIDDCPVDISSNDARTIIENTSMDLATAFYEHLHTWGDRRKPWDLDAMALDPVLSFADGTTIEIQTDQTSGTFALAAMVAKTTDADTWAEELFETGPGSFTGIMGGLFPEVDLRDTSNNINPAAAPPDTLFQFPFPLGATWRFNGPHSWAGDGTPPFSSMDFAAGSGSCSSPPNMWTVATAAGTAVRQYGYDCWIEVEHSPEWTTSYYHMQNTPNPQGAYIWPNASLGQIACEVCAGGYATGPHVHWTVKYNGAYVSLEGVKISGWTIHVGPEPYTSGSIERDGVILNPGNSVLNDYHTYYFRPNRSLRFYGNAVNDIDRLKIQLDNPARPVDVGETNFTIEWWMKAQPGENTAPTQEPIYENWVLGNVIFDRSVIDDENNNEYGVSLQDGRITFGVNSSGSSETMIGTTDVTDGAWHHIAITRSLDGWMHIFVDGQLDASELGPSGNISYLDGHTIYDPNDPYLVVGAEKFDYNPAQRPAFHGWLDEVRFSTIIRYAGNFTPPDNVFVPDAETVALLHFDEGSGDAANDTTGFDGGPSNAYRSFGGSPAGPEWSTDTPFDYPEPTPTPTTTPTATATATPTDIGAPTATNTATPTPTSTATNTPTATATNTPVDIATTTPASTNTPTATATATSTNTPLATTTAIFEDVPSDHWAFEYINALYNAGYVAGCSSDPLLYCPDNILTRAESAVFVLRGQYGAIPDPPYSPPATPTFADVDPTYWGYGWIESMWTDGFTAGCGTDPLIYCPLQQHTRAEGSVFFLRVMHGSDYEPPAATGIFDDVDLGAWYANWVEAAYNNGILPACNTSPLQFCPEDELDRAWAAYMMVQAKGGLPLE